MSYKGKEYIVRRGRVSHAYNSRLSTRTTNMKEVTSRILRSRGYPAPENTVFSKIDLERAWNWAKPILPVVLKPHNGAMGKLVFVNIKNYKEFQKCFNMITEKHNEVLVEKFIQGDEYRFTYVNNEIVAIAKRVPANVVGDGKSNIEQLVNLKNKERKLRKNPIHKKLKLDHESKRVLLRQGYTIESVPNNGQVVYLRENSNISTGGDAIDVTNEIDKNIKEGVRKAIRTIPGLRICGADVLINDNGYVILELNANPMISMHHYPWKGKTQDVASKVIDGMFPQTIGKQLNTNRNSKDSKSISQKILSIFK